MIILFLYYLLLMESKPQENLPEQEEAVHLTKQLAQDLLQLIADKNVEVQHGTISAILQYTHTSEARLMFKDTTLFSYLRKYLHNPKLTTICLSTLIHFALQSQLLPEYFPLIEPLIFKLKEWKQLQLELSLLLILNISKQEQIIARIIGDQQKRGYSVEILYALLEKQARLRWILAGIFVNISTIERGRKFIVDDKIYKRFIPSIFHFEEKLRECSLKVIRNCSFQWEDNQFLKQLLSQQLNFLNLLAKMMSFIIVFQKLISDSKLIQQLRKRYFSDSQFEGWQKIFKSSSKQKALSEISLAIDTVLILSNAQLKEKATGVDRQGFKLVLFAMKSTDIEVETKDKLQALEIFCF